MFHYRLGHNLPIIHARRYLGNQQREELEHAMKSFPTDSYSKMITIKLKFKEKLQSSYSAAPQVHQDIHHSNTELTSGL